jgi:hypothetical protein
MIVKARADRTEPRLGRVGKSSTNRVQIQPTLIRNKRQLQLQLDYYKIKIKIAEKLHELYKSAKKGSRICETTIRFRYKKALLNILKFRVE